METGAASLYDVLGVSPTATPQDIRAAYLRLAKQKHSDRGGDDDAFVRVKEAYDVLRDARRRAAYDAGASGAPPPRPQGWFGRVVGVEAPPCRAVFHADFAAVMKGVEATVRVDGRDVKVHVPPGVPSQCPLVRYQEGPVDEHTGERRDLHVIVKVPEREGRCMRMGSDLVVEQDIDLPTALTGGVCNLGVLPGGTDDTQVWLDPARVIEPNTALELPGEGFPVFNSSAGERGNLVILFNVTFPAAVPLARRRDAAVLLGGSAAGLVSRGDDKPDCVATPALFDPQASERRKQAFRASVQAHLEAQADAHEPVPPAVFAGAPVQCAQQ